MFTNYLITALRNIARHKLFSFISIAGLAVGLACVIFIALFVRDELSYDKWIPETVNLYRVEITMRIPDQPVQPVALVPFALPQAMRDEIAGVTGMTRFYLESRTLTVGNRQFVEDAGVVDPGFFKLIRLPLIMGNPDTVFRQPNSVVLSVSVAHKFFGDTDPIGRIITTARPNCPAGDLACQNSVVALRVTGVMRDLPHNTQLSGSVFFPNTSSADGTAQDVKQAWFDLRGWGYVRLAPGADPAAIAAKVGHLFDRSLTPELRKFGENIQGSQAFQAHLTPFNEVHLTSSYWAGNPTTPGSWTTVYGVVAVGVLVLLMACFNFTNLATARATLRAREIALRKVVGARRNQLMAQFLGEAIVMSLLALAFAFAIAEMLLPLFDDLLERPLRLQYASNWVDILLIIAIAIASGMISGSYPALVLSRFRPATSLRSGSGSHPGSARIRNVLVVLQFAVSIGLGVAAIVIFSQIRYARSMDMGFRRNNIVVLEVGLSPARRQAFVGMLKGNPGIIDVGLSNLTPFNDGEAFALAQIPGRPDKITLDKIGADPDFMKVYGIRLIAGRFLSPARSDDQIDGLTEGRVPANDGHNLIINASAAHRLGFEPQDAVGKTILFNHNPMKIAGVIADAKFGGARWAVKPTAYIYDPNFPEVFSIRLRADSIPQTIAYIEQVWHRLRPATALRRDFVNDDFDTFYRAEERQGEMFEVFMVVAVFIACLGLFGLVAFTANRRTKEIGIRKVFGAHTRDLIFLLLWQFSIPVLIANVIAWPVAWFYLHGWLQGFAYHIALSPLYFLASGAVAMIIAWTTVFVHARRVANANPIHALRYE